MGREGILTPLLKEFLEEALGGELVAHLGEKRPNRKNGKGNKLLKTSVGNVKIETPRDRNGTFEPELVPKRQRPLGVDLDRQILALYACGASYGDISDHLSRDVRPGRIYRYDQPRHRQNPSSRPGMA